MSLRLHVQPGTGSAAEYPLDRDELVIGRSPSAGVVITDAQVSRQHARLVRRDGDWWVEDLGARNTTLLNGAPVRQPERLRAGDRLEVGSAVVRLLGDGAVSAPTGTVAAAPAGDAARIWTINEIHRALAAPMSLSELLDLILARCFDLLDPEEGAIMLRDRDGTLATVATRQRGGRQAPVSIPRRLVDEVVGKRTPALVLDAHYDDRFAGSASMMTSGIRSVVAAPIVDAEGTLGLITLCSRVAVRRFAQPDLDMLVTMASAAGLRVRNVALAEALAARRVVEHELELAHDVQMAMLPRRMPAWPGLQVAARLTPAQSVGGDLYDVLLDGARLWFVVADVAGKSIAAALYMAITKTLFRATVRGAADVADVAARMNAELARENDRMMFVTALLGCLDLGSGRVTLVDAGHNPPLLAAAGGVRDIPDLPKGPAFGVIEDAVYQALSFALPADAALVVFTDGLTDARSEGGEQFGEQRARGAIGAGGSDPAPLVDAVIDAVDRFAAGAPAEDDLTLIALRYAPRG
jgi:phosphoserine phosphatase RsbU/P